MDNAEQTGPFEAARQFLAENPTGGLGTYISSSNRRPVRHAEMLDPGDQFRRAPGAVLFHAWLQVAIVGR